MNRPSIRFAYVDPHAITHKVVRNPQYPGQRLSCLRGAVATPVVNPSNKPGFFTELKQNVRQLGFRNPIVVVNLPEGMFLQFGASRLRVAKELDLQIPAIINDWTGRFDAEIEISPENLHSFFQDPPMVVFWGPDGFDYHYSIEKNRRSTYDPAGLAWVDEPGVDKQFLDEEFPWLQR